MNKEIFDELKKLNSPLAGTSNQPVFEPPEGYFDQMQAEVLQKLKEPSLKQRLIRKLSTYKVAIAASLLLLMALVTMRYFNHGNAPEKATVSDEEVLLYLEDDIDDLDIGDISLYLGDSIPVIVEENLTRQEMEYYLQDNIDDIQEELLFD